MVDDTQPATKGDVKNLGETLRAEMRVERQQERAEDKAERQQERAEDQNEIRVLFEDLKHDVLGALHDLRSNDAQVANHEERIRELETVTGLTA